MSVDRIFAERIIAEAKRLGCELRYLRIKYNVGGEAGAPAPFGVLQGSDDLIAWRDFPDHG